MQTRARKAFVLTALAVFFGATVSAVASADSALDSAVSSDHSKVRPAAAPTSPLYGSTAAPRSTTIRASADAAARVVRRKVLQVAAHLLKMPEEGLDIAADRVIEADYDAPYLNHAQLEPPLF